MQPNVKKKRKEAPIRFRRRKIKDVNTKKHPPVLNDIKQKESKR